jgi:hypothetical protein
VISQAFALARDSQAKLSFIPVDAFYINNESILVYIERQIQP